MISCRHLAATLALAMLGFAVPIGIGPASPAAGASASTADEGEIGRLQLVLDSSGSMKEPAAGGQTKIQAAKAALGTVVDGLPDEAMVGLRVYGATVYSRSDPGACTDSQEVVAPGTDNRAELRQAIARYKPYGETPIGHALREAGQDIGSEGHRTIVLVSDGEATCPPSPCVVARELAQDGIDLRIDVVGLDVSGKAREQLACIADAGGGDYYDAASADDLVRALDRLSTRALRPFQLTGEPVDGGDTEAGAAPIAAGQYVDTLGGAQSENWYLIERQIPGSTLQVGVAGKTSAGQDNVELTTFAPDTGATIECGAETWFDGLSDGDLLFGLALVVDPRHNDSADPECSEGDLLVLVRRGDQGDSAPLDTELLVTEEPPVASSNGLPPGLNDNAWIDPAPIGPTTEVLGGTSFADAQPVEPGTFTGDIVPGETQVFALDVGWGEKPIFDVTFPRRRGALAEAVGLYDIRVRARLFTPVRGQFTYSQAFEGPEPETALVEEDAAQIGAAGPEVRYLNRESSDAPTSTASLPGTYYLVVEASQDDEGESYTVPYTMRVDLPAGTEAGEPDYEGTDATTPDPATAEPSPEQEDQPAGDDEAASDSSDDGIGTVRLVAGVGVGALGLVVLGLAAFLLARRRSR